MSTSSVGWWLATCRTGASSTTLAAAILGAVSPDREPAYPHDSDDFGRCAVLWNMTPAPEATKGLEQLAAISGPWDRLAARWDELLVLYERDRDACHELIRSLVSQGSGMYETRKGADGRWDRVKVQSFERTPKERSL